MSQKFLKSVKNLVFSVSALSLLISGGPTFAEDMSWPSADDGSSSKQSTESVKAPQSTVEDGEVAKEGVWGNSNQRQQPWRRLAPPTNRVDKDIPLWLETPKVQCCMVASIKLPVKPMSRCLSSQWKKRNSILRDRNHSKHRQAKRVFQEALQDPFQWISAAPGAVS